ncbi:MAG TPA: RHS repeat-associated core domain-containing protein [Chthoniobacterales bacterium]|nr:RHS repeat-associated core domain-containing protein [Chthoniobacterales bacterium]
MKTTFIRLAVLLLFSGLGGSEVLAQAGNDNPTGPAGEFNGDVTTGCHYDPYTGNAKRSVTDITVEGGVGTQPLAFTRTSNSRYAVGNDDLSVNLSADFGSDGNWVHSYQWAIDTKSKGTGKPTTFTVRYDDGRVVTFGPSSNGDPYYKGGKGVADRLQVFWDSSSAGRAYLIRPDGGKIWFSIAISHPPGCGGCSVYTYTVQGIVDPYGQVTTITGSVPSGLVTITEPAGRWIKLYYTPTAVIGNYVIDHLSASDGRTVQYNYAWDSYRVNPSLSQVTYYNDPTLVALYTYAGDNTGRDGNKLLNTAVDPMFAGPMWKIAYRYATGKNADGTDVVYGQILSENYFDGTYVGPAVSTMTITGTGTRKETRGDGKTRTFTFNTSALLTNWTDFKGNSMSQSYDSNGYVNAITDFNAHTTNFTKNAFSNGLLTKTYPSTPGDTPANTPRGTASFTYGSTSCPDPNNRDANNPYYICTSTDEAGHVTTFFRDTAKRITRINYPDGGTESFQYNGFGQPTSHTMRSGGIETAEYDNRGLAIKYRDPYHATGNPSALYQYDALDRVIGVTDALGASVNDLNHTTNYSYNLRGQVLVTTFPVDPIDNQRHTIINAYNPNGNGTLISVTDRLNNTTRYVYDDYKRVISVTTPGHNVPLTSSVCYAAICPGNDYTFTDANPQHVFSPSQAQTSFIYDDNRRKLSVTVADGTAVAATTSYAYDNNGNLTSEISPNQQPGQVFAGQRTINVYDERNRLMTATDPLGSLTTFKYDAGGRQASVTRSNGQITTYDSYDAMNRLLQQTVKQTPSPSAVTKYTYDMAGLLHSMQDPRLVATNSSFSYTYGYDLLGRKTALSYPPDSSNIQRAESWHYDTLGRADVFTNRSGKHETLVYDNLNRLIETSWDDGITPAVHNVYDTASRLIRISNANAIVARALFNDGLLSAETTTYADNTPRTVAYTYDTDGNRATIQYPSGRYSFAYQYTRRNQLQYLIDNGSGIKIASYGYDQNGNLTNRTLMQSGLMNSNFIVDGLNRVTHVAHSLNGTTRTFDYGYDSVGNQKWTKRDGSLGDVFGYDANDQSISALLNVANPDNVSPGSQTINYDANGNRTTFSAYGTNETYITNNLNQYTTRNSVSAGYDVTGNLAAGFDGSAYTYDALNRLISASKGGTLETFAYDGLNRQVSRRIGNGAPVYNVYDSWTAIGEYSGGSTTPSNAYLLGANGIVKNLVTNRHFYQDNSGSTSHVTDGNGNLIEWYRYDLQGVPFFYNASNVQNPSSGSGVRHLFHGEQWYSELGLYDLRNRFYSPNVGRFLQPDPISFAGDPTHLYRYCANNPLKYADPTGENVFVVPHPPIGHASWGVSNPMSPSGITWFDFGPRDRWPGADEWVLSRWNSGPTTSWPGPGVASTMYVLSPEQDVVAMSALTGAAADQTESLYNFMHNNCYQEPMRAVRAALFVNGRLINPVDPYTGNMYDAEGNWVGWEDPDTGYIYDENLQYAGANPNWQRNFDGSVVAGGTAVGYGEIGFGWGLFFNYSTGTWAWYSTPFGGSGFIDLGAIGSSGPAGGFIGQMFRLAPR